MAHLGQHAAGVGHGDPRERDVGDRDHPAEQAGDLVAVVALHGGDDVAQPALLDGHDLFVRLDPGHLDVDAHELGVVTGGDVWVGPEHRTDLEHPLEAGAHRHLLVELR